MPNIIYNHFLAELAKNNIDLDDGGTVVRAMLERDTSTYTPDKDHQDRADLTGFVEISVASYSRQTVANKAVNEDSGNDRAEWDFDDIAFGTLESGQTVQAILLYVQVGGDDTTPADDILICYLDSATNLPSALSDGPFTIQVNAEGMIQLAQA